MSVIIFCRDFEGEGEIVRVIEIDLLSECEEENDFDCVRVAVADFELLADEELRGVKTLVVDGESLVEGEIVREGDGNFEFEVEIESDFELEKEGVGDA